MKKLYTTLSSVNINFLQFVLVFSILFCASFNSYGQVRVPFEPRTSDFSPTKTVYNVKGDFTMIGNSNLTLVNYGSNEDNSNEDMRLVDIDGDNSTSNSSSSTLSFSTENGATPECSNIIYAGLYWTGRNNDNSSDVQRRTVKFKGPGQTYTTLVADTDDIRYPGDRTMFAGYKEVTSLVKDGGLGDYFVADIALSAGDGGSTGYYGGWGMVVVYENSKMNWRDITVFDGYAYVQGSTVISHTLDVSGFNAVQNGDVNIKLGMMAGEGDVGISGDYFQIRRQSDNTYQSLSHSGNSTSNFFNSSIQTGGNTRSPNRTNNTGLDIAMFDVPNPNNSIIDNNQTSTRFRYGSTQDTYIIFNVTFAVDAYVPETEGLLAASNINGQPAGSTLVVEPGESIEYSVEIRNKGTEAIDDGRLVIPIPYTSEFVVGSLTYNAYNSNFTQSAPYFDVNEGPTGSIVWDLGTIPLPDTINDLLADISFELTCTTDCSILVNDNCTPKIVIVGGNISGTGQVSETEYSLPLIQGYQENGSCQGEPNTDPIEVDINSEQYIIDNCTNVSLEREFFYCDFDGNTIPVSEISGNFPPGSRFYDSYPITDSSVEYTTTNPFPATVGSTTYYAIPQQSTGCSYIFTITINDIPTVPTFDNPIYCINETASPLTATTTDPDYILMYYPDNLDATPGQLTITPSTSTVGTFTYYVAEGPSTTCLGDRAPITVTVVDEIVITETLTPTTCSTENSGEISLAVTGGSGSYTFSWDDSANSTTQNISDLSAGTYTVTVSDSNTGCETTGIYEILVEDDVDPILSAPNDFSIENCNTDDITAGDFTSLDFNETITTITEAQFLAEGGTFTEDNVASITYQDVVSGSCSIVVTRTFTITDNCNATASDSQTITINTPPLAINEPDGSNTVNCLSEADDSFTLPQITDACGNSLTPSEAVITDSPSTITCEGTRTYTYTYTDCNNNQDTWTYSYTIEYIDFEPITATTDTADCYANIVVPTPPTVLDNCGNTLTPTGPVESTTPECEGDVTYTWTYTDCANNTQDYVHTVTIEVENFEPITATTDTADCYANIVVPTPPTVLDNCGNTLTPTGPVESTTPECEGDVTYTWTYTDCANNTQDYVHTVTIEVENFEPITATTDTADCYANIVVPTPPTVLDNCGNTLTPTGPVESSTPDCEGDVTYTWTYTDCANNTQDYVHTVTIEVENFEPITATTDTADCYANIVVPTPPTVLDNCGNTLTPTGPVESSTPECEGDVTYTWTYTDCANNTQDYVHTVTIEVENFQPITATTDTADCYANIVVPTPPTVLDNCGNTLTPTGPVESTTPECEGDVTYTWTYTDCANNTQDYVHTVTIEVEPFTINEPNGNETVACASLATEPTPPTVLDNCGNTLTPTGPVQGGSFDQCEGTISYTWTYTDCANQTLEWSYTYNVQLESIQLPQNQESQVACADDADANLINPPVINDSCGSPITPIGPTQGGTYDGCQGTITYTYTYPSCQGTNNDWVYTYNVVSENFEPIAATTDTADCYANIVVPTPPTVLDNCGNTLTPTGPVESTTPECEGDVTYTWTYTDCANNTQDYVHTVTIEVENFEPITATTDTADCYANIVVPTPPTVLDNCGNTLTPAGPVESTTPDCEGEVTYTWTYTDCANNTQDYVHTVTIEVEPFTINEPNGNETVACASLATEPTPPTVLDNCGNTLTPTGPVQGGSFDQCEGTISYTWTYTDCANQTLEWSYTYNVQLESIQLPQNQESQVACADDADANLINPPVINDSCGSPITPIGPTQGGTYDGCQGTITYTYTYPSCQGTNNDWVYTYNVVSENFEPIAATTDTADCYANIVVPTPPTVLDNCGNTLTPTGPVESSTPECEGDVTYTWTYTDCANNTQDYVHTVTIEVENFEPITATTDTADCYANIVVPTPPTVLDNCGNTLTPAGPVESTTPDCEGEVTYTWTYTDCANNTQDYVHTVTIEVENFQPITATTDTADCYANIVVPTPPTVLDNCGNTLTPTGPVESSTPECEGDVTYTWTYTDCANNTQDYVHTVTIEVENFEPITATTDTADCYANIVVPTPPTVLDNCGNTLTPTGPVESTTPECEGDVTYTWTYTDCANNTQDYVHTVTIEVEPFTINEPNGNETVACASLATEPTPPTVLDNCGNTLTPTGPVQGGSFDQCEGTISYTWTYTDCANQTLEWSYTYNVQLESIQLPQNQESQVACADDADANLINPPVINDSCGSPITPIGPTQGGTYDGCQGTITYTYTYPSCQGTNNDWVYTYNVVSENFEPIAATTDTADCYANIVVPTPPTVLDNCGNTLTPTGPVESSTPECEGDVTYTWTYTDCANNTQDYVHTVTIEVENFEPITATTDTADCYANIVVPTPPTVLDNCGNTLTPTGPVESSTPDCEGEVTYTWTYTDCANNTQDYVHTVTIEVEDFEPIAATADTADCYANIVVPTPPTVLDNCGNTLTPTGPVESSTPDCEGEVTYTWTYTDCANNTQDYVHTVTIEVENFQPITATTDTADCYANIVVPTPPTVLDNCGNTLTPTGPVESSTPECEGDVTYTWTYTDCANNTQDYVHTVTIEVENFEPITATTDTADCYANIVVPTPPTVLDNCGNTLTPTGPVESTTPDCEGEVTYTWTYTDCANNTQDYVHTVTIEVENFQPITATTDTADCYANIVVPTPPTVLDNCGNTLTPTGPVESSTPECEGDVTYTWTYTDCANNTQDYVHTVTIEVENFEPITATTDTADCYANIVVPTPPTVLDNCGNTLTPTGPVESSTPDCEGEVTYTWTYTDCANNTQDYVHTVTIEVEDFEPIAATADTADCYANIVVPTPPTVLDNCGNTLTPTGPVESSTPDCEGEVTYTWTYTDCANNTQDYVHTVTIEVENFQPITATTDTADCYANIVVPTPPTVLDNCGNTLTPTGPVESSTPECEGDVTYTWTYTDCANNTQDYVHTVTIEVENFEPITATTDTADCYANIVVPTPPTVLDNCGNTLTPTGPVESTTPECEGDVTYTWTYTDCANNTQDYVHTVTIEVEPFTINEPNGNETVACASLATEPTPPTVLDNCGNTLTPTGPVQGGSFDQCEGTISYTWTYTDCANQTLEWSYTYNVQLESIQLPQNQESQVACADDADPSLINPPVINDSCGSPITPIGPTQGGTYDGCQGTITYTYTYPSCQGTNNDWVYTYNVVSENFEPITATTDTADCYANIVVPTPPTVLDNCGNTLTPTGPVESSTPECEGDVTYTWTYTDCANNTQDYVHTVTIEVENFQPITATTDTADCYANIVVPTPPTVLDNCGNTLTPTGPVESTTPECEGDVTYTWTYTDCANNTQEYVHTVTIEVEAFSLPDNVTNSVSCVSDAQEVPTPPVVTDNCGNEIIPNAPIVSADPGCSGDKTYTWTYTDCAGNSEDWVYTYSINDDIAPEAPIAPADITLQCITDLPASITLTATDNCAGDIVVSPIDTINDNDPCNVIITRTWNFTDSCNNTTSVSQIITVNDTTAPTVTNDLSDIFVSCSTIPEVPELIFDDCSNNVTIVSFDETNTSDGSETDYEIIWNWTIVDSCGNEAQLSQAVYVTNENTIINESDDHCIDDGVIDLFDYYNGNNMSGTWISVTQNTTLVDGEFDPANVELGDYIFEYSVMEDGCTTTTRVTITINNDCVVLFPDQGSESCSRDSILVSTAITPNGDQYNEYFEVESDNSCNYSFDIQVFNRWGAIVYKANNYQNNWNGSAHKSSVGGADKVPNGTYYYIINVRNSGFKPLTGYFYVGTK
ncbi:HYR-like domain-containing protein [Bizionia sp. KMM 8389]